MSAGNQRNPWKTVGLWVLLMVMFVAFYRFFSVPGDVRDLRSLTADVQSGNVASLRITPSSNESALQVQLQQGGSYEVAHLTLEQAFSVARDSEAPYTVASESSSFPTILIQWLPLVVMFLIFFAFVRSRTKNTYAGPTIDELKKARIDVVPPGAVESLTGLEVAKEQLAGVASRLSPSASGPRRVLLEGPPGSGKTALIRWVAAQHQLRRATLSGSDVTAVFVGIAPARVRRVFELAKENTPCLAVIEDLDGFASRRVVPSVGPSNVEEWAQTESVSALLELCRLLDEPLPAGVAFIATTNRLDRLDGALLRQGRFDLHLRVGPGDAAEVVELPRVPASAA